MNNIGTSCFRFGDGYKCPVCQSYDLVKNGKTSNGKQRYQCKDCGKRFITNYTYKAYLPETNDLLVALDYSLIKCFKLSSFLILSISDKTIFSTSAFICI